MTIQFRTSALLAAFALAGAAASASAQSVLFDFNNAPLHSSLPIDQVSGGITAHLSATGQGFSIQDNSAPVFPAGFSGRCIYPNSIFLADLLISFDHTLTDFSILYCPDELGCDDSCMMRVTAYMNGALVGHQDHTAANPGTYPVDTLACSFPQGFNSVVVHYQSHPPTCQDYGVIFLADDMRVTPAAFTGTPFCFGDGSLVQCPCSNNGAAGHGCQNSALTGGALLTASGNASLSADTLLFSCSGLLPSTLAIVFQGNAATLPMIYGDGLRCAGGVLKRMYVKTSVSGMLTAPEAGDPSASARSAALGDPIPTDSTRVYHVYYRDLSSSFCPEPQGSWFNVSHALSVQWAP
jgi:hypothetical protein